MKKSFWLKVIFFLLTVVVLSSAFIANVCAADLSCLELEYVGDSCVIAKCDTEAEGVLNIPQKINGKTVISVNDEAFYGCNKLTEIMLPDTVRIIGESAFSACTALTEFDMPDSVENIGKSVFSKCYALKRVSLSQSISFIPDGTFYMCLALQEVDFPDGASIICKNAFNGCIALKKIVLPESVTDIYVSAFSDCKNLVSVYLPASVTLIAQDAFYGCDSLKSVYFQGSETKFQTVSILSGNGALGPGNIIFNHIHKQAADKTVFSADCTQSGYTEYKCPCGITFSDDFIEASGHNLTEFFPIEDSDCINSGLAYMRCSRCIYYEEIVLPLRDHTPVTDAAVKPTCVKTGLTKGSHCSICGKTLVAQNTVPVVEHTYTKKITDSKHLAVAGTYTIPAKYYYSCQVCNAVSNKLTYNGSTLTLGKTSKFVSTVSKNSITLSWNKVKGATGYVVYYKNSSGKWKAYKKLTANSLKLSNLSVGKTYDFAVKAYVVEKGTTVYAPTYAVHKTATQPVAPAKITATQNETAIRLNWSASVGATHYQLYYYSNSKKKWVLYKTNIKACKYTIYNLKTGASYKFAVRPYINTGDKTVAGSSYITIATSTKPKAPVLKSTALKSSVRLNWSKVSGADGYVIYYSTKSNSGYSKIATTTALTYTKSGLTSGKTYYFKAYSYKKNASGVVYSYAGTVKAVTTR